MDDITATEDVLITISAGFNSSSLTENITALTVINVMLESRLGIAADDLKLTHLMNNSREVIDRNVALDDVLDVNETGSTTNCSLAVNGNKAEDVMKELNPSHRFSVMLLSTPRKSIGCSSPDESLGLKTANFLEIITIPVTNFSCHGRGQGYFVDNDIFCRVFHYCQDEHHILSFICPTCTLFHEEKQLCDFWYNVECQNK